MAALFAGFECVAPPLFGFPVAGLDDGVAGDERLDGGDAELDGFLDDEVHVFSLGNCLGQGDGRQGCGRKLDRADDFQRHLVAGNRDDFRFRTASQAIEHGDGFTGFDAQDLREVARLVVGEGGICFPGFGW